MKTYLGDGAYASFDGYVLRLYTSDGIRDTNEVFLEGDAVQVLVKFIADVEEASK